MINVSSEIKQAYDVSNTQIDKIILDGQEYRISNVQYSDDCYNEGNIFGTAIAKNLEFEIENSVNLEGKEFEYLTGIKIGKSFNWVNLGKFITYEVESNDTTNIAKISAMDYMLKSNIPYISNLDYESSTVTLLDVLKEACANSDMELVTTEFANNNFIVDSNQFEEGTLIRQVLQAVAGVSGTVAKIKNDNKLYLINPNKVTEVSKIFTLNNYKEAEIKRNTHPINVVSLGLTNVDGENITLRDEESIQKNGENVLAINDNPFAYTQEKREQLITALFDAIKGFEYKSYTFKCQGLHYLETIDKIQFKDKSGNSYDSYVFRFNYKSPNGLESNIEAPSIINAVVKYQNVPSALDVAKHAEFIVNKMAGEITLSVEKSEEALKQATEIKQNSEGITNIVSDLKQEINKTSGDIESIEKSVDTLEQTINGLENTLETQGGSNLLLNSSGLFDNEYWKGIVNATTNTDIQNSFIAKACFNLQNGSMKQTINVINGSYYIGFKYQKLLELSVCKVKINDTEIELTETNLTEVNHYIEVANHSITIELISDTDDSCLIGDIIVVQGSKQSWSSNMNEIYTSTVKIGIGMEIVSNTMKTKLLANADGVRIVNTISNTVKTEFTDKGTKTDELEANTAKIAGILIQNINNQTWISSLL